MLRNNYRWQEEDGYFLSLEQQRSPAWLDLKFKRNTATSFLSSTLGSFDTPEETADYLCGIKTKTFTSEAQERMDLGNLKEPLVRQWYEYKYDVKIEEVGLAIPKDDFAIGASSDGMIENGGLIEIKTTATMYRPLADRLKRKKEGERFSRFQVDHIWSSHYYQMQGQMAILGEKWCDYLVLALDTKDIFRQRIYFDSVFWETVHEQLRDFEKNLMEPRKLLTPDRPRIDPI